MEPNDPDFPRTAVGAGSTELPPGYALQEFVIESVLGVGGFGIVYRARDTRLQREVAVKEYMPAGIAARAADLTVSASSQRQRETFETGLRSFVNEAQLLASFDHPSLLRVHRFWEANGTAYMVMPLYRGVTLKAWLKAHLVPPDEAWLLALLQPLTLALELLHNAQPCCLHRDVAPDNILLLEASLDDAASASPPRPLLLDFGAARRVIGDMTHTLTVFLKPGYAPVEQYGEVRSMKQGPWTDVYALSAVLYACIAGRTPLAAVDRLLSDDLVPAARVGAGRYTRQFLAAIDAGLGLRPEQRPQSMAQLRRLFAEAGSAASEPAALVADSAGSADEATVLVSQRPPAERPLGVALGAVAVAATALGAWWWLQREPPATEADAAVVASRPGTPPAATPPPVAASPAPQPVAAEPFSVLAALRDIVAHGDPQIEVTATADKSTLVIGHDSLRFRVRASEAGHVYVFSGGTDKQHFQLLFPNRLDKANRIGAGAELVLPRKSWEISAEGPAGDSHLVVLVSRHERDLSQVGLRQTDEPIPSFDLLQAERLWQQRAAGASPYVGVPVCSGCSDAFGAALLAVREVNREAAGR